MVDLISRAAAIEAVYYNQYSPAVGVIKKVPAVDAIPVEWMIGRANDPERAPLYRRYIQMLYEEWRKEQEARS